jgi:hypothetical protein
LIPEHFKELETGGSLKKFKEPSSAGHPHLSKDGSWTNPFIHGRFKQTHDN